MKLNFDRGLLAETTINFHKNILLLAIVVVTLMVVTLFDARYPIVGVSAFSSIIWAILAMSVHATILKGLPGFVIHKEGRFFLPFLWRTLVFAGMAVVAMAIIVKLWVQVEPDYIIYPVLGIYALIEALLLSKWGTLLPAVIANGDTKLATAGRRGSKTFFYVFLRLVFGVGLGYLAAFALLFVVSRYLGSAGIYWSLEFGFDFKTILIGLVFYFVFAYQIVMIATILSRAYLIAESEFPID